MPWKPVSVLTFQEWRRRKRVRRRRSGALTMMNNLLFFFLPQQSLKVTEKLKIAKIIEVHTRPTHSHEPARVVSKETYTQNLATACFLETSQADEVNN